ncbi:MAG: acyl-CoA dehydrogenase family protein [Chloroflexi bacterium]|nr:acyl-CoA dehydrogenase family protein [Chloroflexota bacterium]
MPVPEPAPSLPRGYQLPDHLRLLQSTVRDYIQREIIPLERELDPDAFELPRPEYERLCKATRKNGIWCMDAPRNVGGGGLDCFSYTVAQEEMVQHRNGLYGAGYGTFGLPPPPVMYEGTTEQIERYVRPTIAGARRSFIAITEPSGGSDPARAIQTRARRDGDDWMLSGEKVFVTGGLQADYGIVFARTDPARGRQGLTCFIVEKGTPGVSVRPMPVLRPYYPAQIVLQDVRVPSRNVLGEVNGGWNILAHKVLARERIPYSAASLGVAVTAQRMAVSYARQRSTFGQPLAQRQAIQWMLVESDIEIRACRWLVWEAAWAFDRGEDFGHQASAAKVYSSEALGRVVDRAVQVHGAYGVSKDLPLERWYREARIRRIGEGPNEVLRMVISRYLLGG